MLQFFRRYQKFFFVIVTFVIVISFSFFGTFQTFTEHHEIPDREIGKLIDGTPLMEQKLSGLNRLLEHGLEEGGRNANFLSDSLIHKEFILSGLAEILVNHCYDEFATELSERWKRIKNYVPYSHPYAPHINAKNVWNQMAPRINLLLEQVKEAPQEFSKEQVPLLFELYAAQADFPPPLLLQMLYYQQMQSNQVRPDPGLPTANVALFGFESIEDWFGSKFVEEVGKFILNAAIVARQEGYLVKKEEAEVDLLRNIYKGLKIFAQGEQPTNEQAYLAFQNQVRSLNLTEGKAIEYWLEVLLFKRLFHEVGEGIFLDRLALQQFKGFAKPCHVVRKYELPEELRFKDFLQMLKFQRYLEIVYEGDYLDLPEKEKDPQVIRDDHPELVYKLFEIEVASVKKGEIATQIGLKQTWDWEIVEENFSALKKEFPPLAEKKCSSVSERREALDELNELVRLKVDNYARRALINAHPEWIESALVRAPKEKKQIKVRLKGGDSIFSGERFLGLLETESEELQRFTVDNETFYSIRILEKGRGWHILSFEEACLDSTLDESLDILLETAHTEMDFKEPYEECKKEVAVKVYGDLLGSIGKQETLDDYALHRFDRYLEKMRNLVATNKEEFEKIQRDSPWALVQKEEEVLMQDDIMREGEFSPVASSSFFQLIEKKEPIPSDEELAMLKNHLRREAEQKLMEKVLESVF